jgi:hypothetical protein
MVMAVSWTPPFWSHVFIRVEKSLIAAIVSSTINVQLALAPFCIGLTLLIRDLKLGLNFTFGCKQDKMNQHDYLKKGLHVFFPNSFFHTNEFWSNFFAICYDKCL